jgi:hypothetical protein
MPLKATDARTYIRGFSTMASSWSVDDLTDTDAINIMRGGVVREPEWENGSWRYRVETPHMCFVVAFDPEPDTLPAKEADLTEVELVVVTAWRIRS